MTDTMEFRTRAIKLMKDPQKILLLVTLRLIGPFDVPPDRIGTKVHNLDRVDFCAVDKKRGFDDVVDRTPRMSPGSVAAENRLDLFFIGWLAVHDQQPVLRR